MKKLYSFLFLLFVPFWLCAQGTPIDKSAWTVTYVDSEMPDALGSAAIDDNLGTSWHTEWTPNSVPPPHTIEIDMGAPERVYCYGFIPRPGDNGRPKECIISVKINPGDSWTEVASGITVSSDSQQNFYFDAVDAQYIKLEILSNWNSMNHSVIAEIYAYTPPEIEYSANKNHAFKNETVTFQGYSSFDNPVWSWNFVGGTPASGSSNPMQVIYATSGVFDVSATVSSGSNTATLTKPGYIAVTDTLIPHYGWTCEDATAAASQGGNPVEAAIDGNPTTFYSTPYTAPFPPFPHYYIVDMGKVNPVTALEYVPRKDAQRNPKGWEFWLSEDNVTYTKVKEGVWPNDNTYNKLEILDNKVDARYFKMVCLSNYQADPADTRFQICELNAYGDVRIIDFTYEVNNLDVTFSAYANKNPVSYSWIFENGSPSTSSQQNPTISFTVPGSNAVTCTAKYADNEEISITKQVIVRPFEIPRDEWVIVEVVDEEPAEDPNGWATNLFDGDLNTYWHTQWANQYTEFPHHITVDMGRPYNVSCLSFDQRKTGTGRPKDIVLYTSMDGINFDATAYATWENDAPQKVLFFDNVEAQFFNFVIETGYSAGTEPFSCGAELQLYGSNTVIYWENPADIEVGTKLSETQLNATANVPGVFTYDPPIGTELPVGTHNLTVEFVPTNTSFSPDVKVVQIVVTNSGISTSGWTVHFVDSYEFTSENTPAENTFDGDLNTMWHTQYDPVEAEYPHQLIINMGDVYILKGLTIYPRQDGAVNGMIKDYEIWTSVSGGMNASDSTIIAAEWTKVASGTWEGNADAKIVSIADSRCKYFRILALNEMQDQNYASIAEIKAYGGDGTTAILTWTNPADMLNGTPLSSVQLNATADVAGTFVYTPPAGTVLPFGNNQPLKVDFTPSDTTYKPATKTVYVNVISGIGISEATNGIISVYPNPADRTLAIANISEFSKSDAITLTITNSNGKTVFTKKLTKPSDIETVDVSQLPSGVFLLILQTPTEITTKRFVKQ